MKKVIALIISIAMVASFATGLAVTGFAVTGTILGLTLNDVEINGEVSADGNTLIVNPGFFNYYSNGIQTVNIPEGKKLYVSETGFITCNSANITINGPGELEIHGQNTTAFSTQGTVVLNNVTATIYAAYGSYAGNGTTINNSKVDINSIVGDAICASGSYENSMSIENSYISINSAGSGITGSRKNLVISGSELKINSGGKGISLVVAYGNGGNISINSGEIEISSAEESISAGANLTIDAQNTYLELQSKSTGITLQGQSIKVTDIDGTTANIVDTSFPTNLFTYGATFDSSSPNKIKTTNKICFGVGSVPYVVDLNNEETESTEESDPEVELDLGNGPVTLKTSNNSVVVNDTKVFETNIGDGDVFVPIDLSSTPVKLDGLFFNNEVYKYIDDSGKDIKLINRFATAEVYTNKEIGLNPLSLHLSDVSEVPGTCATAIQKAAMQTDKVYAQVNYSFVSNGNPTDNNAKIYVPVDGPAKVFYLFNENKIGIVPCEVKDGYCEFNRYFDGSYVICSAS